MSQKIYLNILRIGVYLSLICVFFVFKGLLFPFITSKQIPFNIIMEILAIFWIAFLIKYPEYRPKKSYITLGLLAFFIFITLSCFTGVDFNLSFWGDVERMLGVFHILHFLLLYFIIITVFREWKDWKILFIASVICAVFISFMGMGEGNMTYSQIGNTAYLSAYLIFNIYFAILLFYKEENKGLRWLYLIPLPVYLIAFKNANTSGAYVGLGISIMIIFFLYGVLTKNKKIKIATWSGLILLVILVSWAFAYKNSPIVANTPGLQAINGISFQKRTFQTRLISWKAALKDFKNQPILGTGFGNYAVIFDKHFEPTFYNYTREETYFDRAHNNLIDIASTTGILGLITYLSIFIALAYYLIRGYRKKYISIHEFIFITALISAYFIQNLAVFDSFVTYMALIMVLGYVYWLNYSGEEGLWDEIKEKKNKIVNLLTSDRRLENKEIYTLFFVGFVFISLIYQYNIKPYKMLQGTIEGQKYFAQGQVEKGVETYRETLGLNTVLDRDSRTSIIRIFSNGGKLDNLEKEKQEKILDYIIELAEANVEYNQKDSLNQMMLAQVLNTAASKNTDNMEKFNFYSNRALEAIDKSIEASPGRVPIYFQKAQIYLTRGDKDKGVETLEYAYNLNPIYYDSACHLGKTLLYFKEEEKGYKYMDECIDLGGTVLFSSANTVKALINHYAELADGEKIIKLYEQLVKLEPKNAKIWINLAIIYSDQGENKKAINAAKKAMEADSSLKQYAEDFIAKLQ